MNNTARSRTSHAISASGYSRAFRGRPDHTGLPRRYRRQRPLRDRGAERDGADRRPLTLRDSVRFAPPRPPRRHRHGVPAAPRARSPAAAKRGRLPRQYRCAEARGRDGHRFAERGGQPARGPGARRLRPRRSVHRPHLRPREELFRRRPRRPCLHGRARVPAARRPSAGGRREPRAQHRPRRYLPRDGRDRSSRPSPNRSSIASGAARSSA